jgi:hypothetical protein
LELEVVLEVEYEGDSSTECASESSEKAARENPNTSPIRQDAMSIPSFNGYVDIAVPRVINRSENPEFMNALPNENRLRSVGYKFEVSKNYDGHGRFSTGDLFAGLPFINLNQICHAT